MYSKSERLLITRFLFSKKTDGYISIFSWFSIIGISLGVAAIIIVMSVMNGFRIDLTKRLLGINSHITIFSNNQFINYEESQIIKKNLKDFNHINILESIETNGLIIKNNVSKGVLIRGYKYTNKEHYLLNSLIEGSVISVPVIKHVFLSKTSVTMYILFDAGSKEEVISSPHCVPSANVS